MSDAVLPSDEGLIVRGAGAPRVGERTPISETAREVLRRRLDKTRRLVKTLAGECDETPDVIHKFRVSIRRSEAALRTFRPLLPKRRSRALRRTFKELRQAAGEIRDVDVFLEHCEHGVAGLSLAEDAQVLRESRESLAAKLRQRARHARRRLKRAIRGVVRRVRWRGAAVEPAVADAAPGLLRPVAERSLTAAAGNLHDLHRLHRFRIDIKRLRYACEFLQVGLDREASGALLSQLSGLQQRIGQVCDRAANIRLLEESRSETSELAAALDRARRTLAADLSAFVAGWDQGGHEEFRRAVGACVGPAGAVRGS